MITRSQYLDSEISIITLRSEVTTFIISVLFYTTATTGLVVDDIIPDEVAFVINTEVSNCHVTLLTQVVIFAV